MNRVLEGNYEKKMAVVALMKQYAENRDIETFSKAVSLLLVNPKHRSLMEDIRYYIRVVVLISENVLTNVG